MSQRRTASTVLSSSSRFVTGAAASVAADGSVLSFTNYFPNNRVIQTFARICDPMTGGLSEIRTDAAGPGEFAANGQLIFAILVLAILLLSLFGRND